MPRIPYDRSIEDELFLELHDIFVARKTGDDWPESVQINLMDTAAYSSLNDRGRSKITTGILNDYHGVSVEVEGDVIIPYHTITPSDREHHVIVTFEPEPAPQPT